MPARVLRLTTPDLTGPDVAAAQELLKQNPFGVFDPGETDADYGPRTAGAVWRAKWELGYPVKQVDSAFGWRLRAYLAGTKPLPTAYAARRQERLAEAGSEEAVRARIVQWAFWGAAHAAEIGYADGGSRLEALQTPGRLPLQTDCSGFATLCYAWADAPNPNADGPYDAAVAGYTGSMLAHCRRLAKRAVQPADLVVWCPPPTGHHVAIVVETGDDPLLVSHGGERGPLEIRCSDESHAQAGYGAVETVWLSAF